MNMIWKKSILLIGIIITFHCYTFSQSRNDWFHIPGLTPEIPITLTNEKTFYSVMGAAALSYVLAELVFKDDENMNFYQLRAGMNNEYVWGLRNVWHQNFGVENRVAPWFAFALAFNFQQWDDRTPDIDTKDRFGMGAGMMSYYRWYLFGKKKISPFLEYGTGLFFGLEKFPSNGSGFTFNHTTQLGLEYTFNNNHKLRATYGQAHQSNNSLFNNDPGYDANGFSISYSWFWKTSKW